MQHYSYCNILDRVCDDKGTHKLDLAVQKALNIFNELKDLGGFEDVLENNYSERISQVFSKIVEICEK